jgi:putative lipoprotein
MPSTRLILRPAFALSLLTLALLALAPAALAQGSAVTGTVTLSPVETLPPSAALRLSLFEIPPMADARATLIGEQVIPVGGQRGPFAFSIGYDPARIQQNRRYSVVVSIEAGGRVTHTNTGGTNVLTNGAPAQNVAITALRAPTLPTTSGLPPMGALLVAAALAGVALALRGLRGRVTAAGGPRLGR